MIRIDAPTAAALGHYVYELVDPANGEPFYVGEGVGGRVLQHLHGAHLKPEELPEPDPQIKQNRFDEIQRIRAADMEPSIRIVIFGLPDKASSQAVEAVLIDTYSRAGMKLSNGNRGFHRDRIGLDLSVVAARVGAADIELTEKAILVTCGFRHKPLRDGVSPWDAAESLRRFNSQREWKLAQERVAEMMSFSLADRPVLVAVTSDSICLGVWSIRRYNKPSGVFTVGPSAFNARYFKRRLVNRQGNSIDPQQGVRYINW